MRNEMRDKDRKSKIVERIISSLDATFENYSGFLFGEKINWCDDCKGYFLDESDHTFPEELVLSEKDKLCNKLNISNQELGNGDNIPTKNVLYCSTVGGYLYLQKAGFLSLTYSLNNPQVIDMSKDLLIKLSIHNKRLERIVDSESDKIKDIRATYSSRLTDQINKVHELAQGQEGYIGKFDHEIKKEYSKTQLVLMLHNLFYKMFNAAKDGDLKNLSYLNKIYCDINSLVCANHSCRTHRALDYTRNILMETAGISGNYGIEDSILNKSYSRAHELFKKTLTPKKLVKYN